MLVYTSVFKGCDFVENAYSNKNECFWGWAGPLPNGVFHCVCFFLFFTRIDFDKNDVESIGILLCFESGNTYNDDSLTTLFKIEPFNFKKSCFC